MHVDAETIRSVLVELSGVYISIGMVEIALALSHSVAPISLVLCAIEPYLSSFSVFDVNFLPCLAVRDFLHLTSVGGALPNLEVCFADDLFLVDLFDFVAES